MAAPYNPAAGDRVIINRAFPDGHTSKWTGILLSYNPPEPDYPTGGGTIKGTDGSGSSIHLTFASAEALRADGIIQTIEPVSGTGPDMATPKLTPTQREVLALIATGKVWRSESSRSLYQWFADGRHGSVSATVKVLLRFGLISIDFSDRMRPVAILADAGRALRGGQSDAVKPAGGEG